MAKTRREFLVKASMGAVATAIAGGGEVAAAREQMPATPGAPPAFGTAPAAGPAVSVETFREAEKLVRVTDSQAHLAEAAGNWAQAMAPVYERRTGPRKLEPGYDVAPATVWNPEMTPVDQAASQPQPSDKVNFEPSLPDPGPLPAKDEDIAFSTVVQLAGWLRTRKITSERLTRIYLERLKRFNPKLNCVITLTEEHALDQARAADAEVAAGHYRGPLHGMPWGAKDLLDTAGIPTTWGAEPFRDRVPAKDAAVTRMLNEAGAVLVAKLSLGALALNDVWFGGETKNPWVLEEGSSGSSAGPGAAVAAGLVGFAIGSETQGSIVSPSMRCGVEGLRPTYGRVPRTGAMTLSWTCDKLGAMARGVEDTILVLHAISGFDPGDTASVSRPLRFEAKAERRRSQGGLLPKVDARGPRHRRRPPCSRHRSQLGHDAG